MAGDVFKPGSKDSLQISGTVVKVWRTQRYPEVTMLYKPGPDAPPDAPKLVTIHPRDRYLVRR